MNCNKSIVITTIWNLFSCSPTCSSKISLNQSIIADKNELFIPAQVLDYGLYELQLTVLNSTSSLHFEIVSPKIIINLVPFGRTMIKHHYQQDLTLDPGKYSFDLDTATFDSDVSHLYSI